VNPHEHRQAAVKPRKAQGAPLDEDTRRLLRAFIDRVHWVQGASALGIDPWTVRRAMIGKRVLTSTATQIKTVLSATFRRVPLRAGLPTLILRQSSGVAGMGLFFRALGSVAWLCARPAFPFRRTCSRAGQVLLRASSRAGQALPRARSLTERICMPSEFFDITLDRKPPAPESNAYPCQISSKHRFKISTGKGADPWDLQFAVQLDRLGLSEVDQARIFSRFLRLPEIQDAKARGLLSNSAD
jgi:hypothetical protein